MTDRRHWDVERRRGSVGALHGLDLPDPMAPTVWVLEPTGSGLVLGSTQRHVVVDEGRLAGAGTELVRRRSGGGAVLVVPGATTWVDVLVPQHHPAWVDDVSRSARWMGRAWVAALGSLDVAADVHVGAMACGRWGSLVCFAGTAPGEVVAPSVSGDPGPAPVKLVGISQRRTRVGARFQCVVHRTGVQDRLVGLLGEAVPAADRVPLAAHLEVVTGVVDVDAGRLVDALVVALGAATPPG